MSHPICFTTNKLTPLLCWRHNDQLVEVVDMCFILASRVEKPGCWEVGNDDEVGGDRGWREIGFYFQWLVIFSALGFSRQEKCVAVDKGG